MPDDDNQSKQQDPDLLRAEDEGFNPALQAMSVEKQAENLLSRLTKKIKRLWCQKEAKESDKNPPPPA